MIISYFTGGYFEWAKVFVESLKLTNGDSRLTLVARNVTEGMIDELRAINPTIIFEDTYDLKPKNFYFKYNLPPKAIFESKKDVESGKINGNHRIWMDITSVEDRMRSFLDISRIMDEDVFIFMDIDVLFRKSIEFLNEAKNSDVGLIIRGNGEDPRIAGGIFTITKPAGQRFLEIWVTNILSEPPIRRWQHPYQQIAGNQTYRIFKDYLRVWEIPYGEGKEVDSKLGKEASIWLFKTKHKENSLAIAKIELERMRNERRKDC